MQRSTIRSVLFLFVLLLAGVGFTAPAVAANKGYEKAYLSNYKELRDRHGVRAPGCNLVTDKFHNQCGGKITKARVVKSTETLRRMLYVPSPSPTSSSTSAPAPSAPAQTSTSSTGGYTIPSDIVMCESGGDYGAVNPSSGAYGAYQILPSTATAHGCDLSTRGGQDSCAAEIWATEGRGAWVC